LEVDLLRRRREQGQAGKDAAANVRTAFEPRPGWIRTSDWDRPCSYCNKCLVNVIENPLGCYEPARFGGGSAAMIRDVMSVYEPTAF
jgi:hypothetical protein